MSRTVLSINTAVLAFAGLFSLNNSAKADTLVIKRPGDHPHYVFDAEPHFVVGPFNPPGPANGAGFGAGFRGTVTLVDNGFIGKINNSVGLGFGTDIVHYNAGRRYDCDRWVNNACIIDYGWETNYFYFPLVMQWNFFLSRNWSVFGEPGFSFHYDTRFERFDMDYFVMFVGGRWHFSRNAALTMRAGYPYFSIGVSLFI